MSNETTRDSMEYDVVIVGAGPAGLAAAIRLKQLNADISIAVLEKGSEVGAHILSGAVNDPSGLDELLPEWREASDCPLTTQVNRDEFLMLGPAGGISIPNFLLPPLMNNHGNYIGSLGNVCRYLGQVAENLGVEIYPGFAAAALVFDDNGAVKGVQVGDMGIGRDGEPKSDYTPGIELHGKYTLLAEGARGSLSKIAIAKFGLDAHSDPQKYGIGIKEVWQIDPEKHKKGLIRHSFGWPLDNKTGGGSFIYHWGDNLVSVGFVVHLNYQNPYLSPFEELQRFKQHVLVRDIFVGAKRIEYGARAMTSGGLQSVPQLAFKGGALLGCAAGFMNVPRIKGSHTAIKSGILVAEAVANAIANGRERDQIAEIDEGFKKSAIAKELKLVRNAKPLWAKFGISLGTMLGGIDMWITTIFGGFSFFGTLRNNEADYAYLKPAADCKKIDYPKPDGKISFDRLSSVFISNTNHEENQPIHLQLLDTDLQKASEHDVFDGPSTRYCPAGVYEWVEENGTPKFVINAQNCVHCKTCDIKDPNQNINWTTPQGGEGPIYSSM
ncbi:MAG: electron transfer flavoprotein-ubiquinone oxidoreductase [Hyphomonadaceae bacterium]|nr:MAG: electron transfer flavoprotein-ubiquinone oxidoreductase [Hyphomonadaceae bacterium]